MKPVSDSREYLLVVQMGKFYEMFEVDAHVGAQELDLQYMKVHLFRCRTWLSQNKCQSPCCADFFFHSVYRLMPEDSFFCRVNSLIVDSQKETILRM